MAITFGTHKSIHMVEVTENAIVLYVKPEEPRFEALVEKLAGKIQETLDYCRNVAEKRSDLRIAPERVEIAKLE